MSTGQSDTRASPSWNGQRTGSDAEIAAADFRVAEARARVERWTRQVENELRRGSPATHSREVLAAFQEILGEMIARREAVVAEFMKRAPRIESDLGETGQPNGTNDSYSYRRPARRARRLQHL